MSDLNDPGAFLTAVRNSWYTALPGFANPDRIDYLTQFVERHANAAIRAITSRV